ncbi:MAG TPA: hypothetical protein PLA72_09515 [Smithellaceae bacterium]|mgnify:CR=1 FL=1|nr:hypothetical protein [Smithella sp.]HQQ88225.1 hypothetical protein [Smithellaceae bacterium]
MNKIKFVFLICILCLLWTNSLMAGSSKDLIKAFKKLDARIQVGISYIDYVSSLGDIQYEFNEYLDSSEAKKKKDLTELLKRVMEDYKRAQIVFKDTLQGPYMVYKQSPEYIEQLKARQDMVSKSMLNSSNKSKPERDFYAMLLQEYPEANKPKESGGALTGTSKSEESFLDANILLQFIWQDASMNLRKTAKMK